VAYELAGHIFNFFLDIVELSDSFALLRILHFLFPIQLISLQCV